MQTRFVSDSYEDLYDQAQQFLRQQKFDDARQVFERIVQRLDKRGDTLFQRRPSLRYLYIVSVIHLAQLAHWQDRFDEALAHYQSLLDCFPEEDPVWLVDMALVKIDKGDVEEGLDQLRAQTMANPGEVRTWLLLGAESMGLGEYADAERYLLNALERAEPNSEERSYVYEMLFELYKATHRYEDAAEVWTTLLDEREAGTRWFYPLCQMYLEAGDLGKAHFWLKKEKHPFWQGLYQGLLARAEGKPDRAEAAWKKVAAGNPWDCPGEEEAWVEASLRTGGEPGPVVGVLNATLAESPHLLRTATLLSIAEARLGHVDHATAALNLAVKASRTWRPRRRALPANLWALVDELVADEAAKAELKGYFDLG